MCAAVLHNVHKCALQFCLICTHVHISVAQCAVMCTAELQNVHTCALQLEVASFRYLLLVSLTDFSQVRSSYLSFNAIFISLIVGI